MSDVNGLRADLERRRTKTALLPVGEPGVTRRWRPRRWTRRRIGRCGAYLAAAIATVAGVGLAAGGSTTGVAMSSDSYRVGAGVLRLVGPGHYVGDGALVITPLQTGVERSAGDVVVGGRQETGVCFLSRPHRQERCVFVIAGTPVSAVDTWNGSGWDRRYDDGQRVEIPATPMAPVPFAVSR